MGKNLIQNWDYRWKLVSFIVLIFSISLASRPISLILSLVISILVLYLAGMTPKEAIDSLKPPLYMLIFMSPFIILTPGSSLLFQWKIIKVYYESLFLLCSIATKSISIFIIYASLLHKSELPKLMQAMNAVGFPGKLVSILISTYRYIYLYMDDLSKLSRAAKLRGFSMRKGFRHMLTSADIMLTLLIRSYEQSERVQSAMILRGYTGDFFILEDFKTERSDPIIAFVFLLLNAGIIIGEFIC